jgi:hypothetical protein
MYHKIEVGIEHVMTGICFHLAEGASGIQFHPVSATMFAAYSDKEFSATWPVTQGTVYSTPAEMPKSDYTDGESRWYANVMASAMRAADDRSYDMQTYNRRGDEHYNPVCVHCGFIDNAICVNHKPGYTSRYQPNEPRMFPKAVVRAMRRKFGKDADEWLAKLRWSHDHWYFHYANMYHGVEPDGHIHT